jgi:hypothetical protein
MEHPLQSTDPLLEEYTVAAKAWGFTNLDLCEIAAMSVKMSGFPARCKAAWLGAEYYNPMPTVANDPDLTNVANCRVMFRSEVLRRELTLLAQRSGLAGMVRMRRVTNSKSHGRFRKKAAECVSRSGIKRPSGAARRRSGVALCPRCGSGRTSWTWRSRCSSTRTRAGFMTSSTRCANAGLVVSQQSKFSSWWSPLNDYQLIGISSPVQETRRNLTVCVHTGTTRSLCARRTQRTHGRAHHVGGRTAGGWASTGVLVCSGAIVVYILY